MKAYRLHTGQFINPFWLNHVSRETETTVTPEGTIVIDGQPLTFAGDSLPPGTPVVVRFIRYFDAYLKSDVDAEKQDEEQRREQQKQNERNYQNSLRAEANAFNATIILPVKWDVGVNLMLSGLSENSWGDGRFKKSVNHILLLEPLQRGRLNRKEKQFLCGGKRTGRFRDQAVERCIDGEGQEYAPKVTCKCCLEHAKRMMNNERT